MSKVTIDPVLCKGCSLCVDACPKKVMRLSPDTLNEKGFHPAELVDENACTSCAFCAIMCPDSIIKVVKP
jgi:2-oxoglutarate ferredoxin oxidoreductase subunit delta